MGAIALEGFWLLAAFAVVYLIGVFTAQWAKDKINGVPSTLRSALKVTEAAAVKELHDARDRLVAETANLLAKGRAAVAAKFDPPPPVVSITPVAPENKIGI
jgi:hypothetical protein